MHIVIFKGLTGHWYWRLCARNGKVVADGSEGYASKSNARRAARRVEDAIASSTKRLEVRVA